MSGKPKLSMYWTSSCGGCEISFVNIHEKLLQVDSYFDFMFCPCLLDTKKKAIEDLPDQSIAVSLVNGAIRTAENEEMAHLLRKKSQLLIAFGSCAVEGCIPGLSNLTSKDEHFATVYQKNVSLDNPTDTLPRVITRMPEGMLRLPAFHNRVRTLDQVTQVDYFIPGCPPEPHQIWNVLETIMSGKPLPPKGSVLGAGKSTVCHECTRKKENKSIQKFFRTHEIIPEPDTCLLEQGLICMGIATADGCGALCPQVNMPCTGCYGAPDGAPDQGANMVSALGSILDIGDTRGISEEELFARIDAALGSIPDFVGTFYKYSLPGSILRQRVE